MEPIEFGTYDLDIVNGNINGGASALQWGPDGLLYVVGRNGFVYAIEVTRETDGQDETTSYSGAIKWVHNLSAPNFDDDGVIVPGGSRQALGIVVTQDDMTSETIIYASHSDIKIGAGGDGGSGDVGLDTNSGIITRIKVSVDADKNVTENEAIDLIRGLPRSEENHATNGLELTTNDVGDPILLIASGGHANAGAPSVNFVGLPEYTYSAAVLSADLKALEAIEAAKKSVDPGIDHVFDLPTLDDPTRPNFTDQEGDVWIDANFDGQIDTVAEFVDQDADGIWDRLLDQDGDGDVDADDMADFVATKIVDTNNDGVDDTILYQDGGSALDNATGVRGGNDALNQAKLLVGNPVQVFSSGYRNLYDVLKTEDGKFYAYDNGANGGWGGVAVTDSETGFVTNEPNNVNETQNFDNLHEFTEGYHAGHPNPVLASGADAGLWTSPTTGPDSSQTLPIADWRELSDTPLPSIGQQDDGLVLPADWDQVVDPSLIDPAAGAYNEGGSVADGALDADKGSWNGLAEYTGTAFGGQLQGAILVTKTNGSNNVKWIKRDTNGDIDVVAKTGGELSDPDTIIEAANQGVVGTTGKGNTLGIDAVGDDGVDGLGLFNNTVWVGSLGQGPKITVFEAGGEPAGADLDKDDDGLDHVVDYYDYSATQGVSHILDPQGTTTDLNAGESRVYNLSAESYPLSGPGGIGQLGFMVNLADPSAEGGLLSSSDNVIPGGAGSGLQIKDIRSGSAKGAGNDQKDALTFAVAPGADVGRLEISTVMNSILTGFYQDGSEAGLQFGTGDQFSYMSLVLAYSGAGILEIILHYEEDDVLQATQSVDVTSLLGDVGGLQRLPDTAVVEFLFGIDTISGTVTPNFRISPDGNTSGSFTQMTPVQASGNVLSAIQGNFSVAGVPHPLGFGNIGTSAIAPGIPAGATEEDNVNVTYDEFKAAGFAPQVDAFVVLSDADITVDESAGTVFVTLELQDELGNAITLAEDVVIEFDISGSALSPDDYLLGTQSPVTISANTTSVPLTITIVDDQLPEADETVEIALGTIQANGLTVIAKAGFGTGSITIDSDDAGDVLYRVNAGDVQVDADPLDPIQLPWAANEGTGPQTGAGFSVNTGNISTHDISGRDASVPDYVPQSIFSKERWDPAASPAMTWSFDVEPGGVYIANIFAGNGFNGTSTPGTRVFNVDIEGAEVFTNVDLSAQFGHQVGGLLSWTGTVLDDSLDIAFTGVTENPTVNGFEIIKLSGQAGSTSVVSVADVTVNEGDASALVTFSLSAPVSEGQVTVPFTLTGLSAAEGVDFLASQDPLEVVFDGSQTATASVSIVDDAIEEGIEEFTVTIDGANISAPAEATVVVSATEGTATVTIVDNDFAPPTAGDVLYRVNTGGPLVAATDGGLDWGADTGIFGQLGNSPYLADAPLVSTTFSNESDGSYDGTVQTAIGVDPTVPLAVFDTERGDRGDDAPTLKYSFDLASDYGLSEGDEVEVRLYFAEIFAGIEDPTKDADGDGTPAGNRVFDVAVDGITPPSFDDIDQWATAGANTGFVRSAVVVVDGDGTLDLEFLNNEENPTIKAIEVVLPGEALQQVSIASLDTSANEADGEITLTFTISEPVVDGDVTVPFTLVSETATVGEDLFPNQDGSVTFPAGSDSNQTVVITLNNDDLAEGDETFTVELGTPTTAPASVNVTTVNGTATIIDDDVDPNVDSFNGLPASGNDWSNINTVPDSVTLVGGANTLVLTGSFGDSDYVSFTVPDGQQVTEITLVDYVGGSNSAFLGLQFGSTIPTQGEIVDGTAALDGGTVYNVAQLGADILPLLASTTVENAGQPTTGFAAPLQAGTYTIWSNQNQDLTESTLEIVSETASLGSQLQLSNAETKIEEGDAGSVTLSFPVTVQPAAPGEISVTYSVDGVEATQSLVFNALGQAAISVVVPNNDVVGDSFVEVVLISTATPGVQIDPAFADATGRIIDDDSAQLIITVDEDIPVGDDFDPYELSDGVQEIDTSASSQDTNMVGNTENNTFKVGLGQDKIDLQQNGGSDTVIGTAQELNGTEISNASDDDEVVIEGGENAIIANVATGSTIVTVDLDGDLGTAQDQFTVTYVEDGVAATLQNGVLKATQPPSADPVRIQAEDFTSSDGYNSQTQGAADGGQVIFLPSQGATGTATFDLAAKGVLPGTYDVTIGHFDESDGESQINVAISSDGTAPFNESFVLDDDETSGNAAQSASFRAKLFSGVEIGENGVLVLTGTTDEFEFARVDFIDFQPVGSNGDGDNTPPFAPFPLPDQTLDENTPFDFNAGALFADAEEDILSFTASSDLPDGVLPDGVLFDDTTGVFSGSPTIPGVFEITVRANDGEFDSAPASFTLTVIDVSDPPVVVAPIADQTLNQGEFFNLDISAAFADPEEEMLSFSVDENELPDGIDFDEVTGVFSGTPTGPNGSYLITVTATDPANGSVTDTFLINLLGDDTRPTVLIEAEDGNLVENFFVEAGSRIRLLQEQSGEATYDLSDVAPGDYIIRVGYFDENDGESTIGVAVTSTGQPDFANSFIADDDATSGNKAQAESFRVKTLDGTLSLGPDGVLTLTGQADEFEFVRIDYLELVPVGGGGNFAPVEAGNGAPDISLDGLIPVSGTIAPAFSDPEEDPLTYAKVAGPDWLDVSPVTGALSGTPDAGGVFEVTVSATDVNNNPNAPATSDFTITVDSSGNAAPTLDTPIAPITVAQDALFEEAVTFTDPEGGDIIYSLAEGTPEWLGIDEFGTLSGQPGPADVVDNLLVEVIATDVLGASNSVLVDVTVSNVNDDPELGTPLVGQAAVVAEPFTYELPIDAFTDPDAFLGDTLTFSATLANGDPLPTWLSIDQLTGTLSGTPDSDTDLAVVIRATDVLGAFVDAPALSIVVTGDPIPVDPVTIEAEDFTGLPGSEFAVNNIASASGGQIIRLPSESSGTVTTDLSAFAGASYKVAVNYIDENDGVSSAKVLVDGVEIGTWLFDGQSGEQLFPGEATGGLAALGNYRVIEFATPFPVTPTSVLTLEVTSNASEFGRVDSIELIPSAGGPTNQAPTAVTLVSVLPQGLAEDADTSNPIKVADIVVTDDGLGANTLGLIGADAGSFEIVGDDLFLKAGTVLDATGNPTLDVAVTADDITVGSTPDATSATLSVPVNDGTPSEDEVVLRINAFGPQVAAIDGGPVWQADGNGSPDNQYLSATDSRGDTQGYSGDQAAIPDTVPQAVLDTARSSNAPFFYNIPVSDLDGPGVYRVVLYIAELFPAAQTGNFRIFDSSVEGGIPFQLDNIDPGAAFGANVGVLSAEVDVQDGVLNLGLLQNVPAQQNPIINAIEIVKVGGPGGADTQPPTVSIGLTNPVDAATPLLVDVTLADASGIDASSLGSDDLTLSINGSPTAASVNFTGFAGGVASYAIAAPGGAWANGASVSVGVAAGAILDLASPANGNLATSQSLVLDLGSGSAPTNAAEAFAAQTDLDTSATYTNGEVGAAMLEVTAGSNNIQDSNFTANSFEVTNVGDKKISAIFIDASSALYPDSVFDPDGQGGDSTDKPWAVNNDGGTGAFVSGTGYFLPGPDPLPNNTGTGISSNGGFKGAMVKFNQNNSNGFENGETVGFSGDMDPNSIAGLTKASVDDTAIDSWDVGGISGHELIGSAFTVLFDDGTTATGYLNSDGSASGATTIASQANPPSSAPGLVVNGVSAGGTGTYGVTQPTVIVSGSPGDLVRITLTKGFDPVTSGAPSNIDQLVEDRLDRYDFKVNNSFDLQTQDVIVGPGGTFDASDLFDYNTAVANNVQDGTFPGDDVQQIAFVAAVIDPSNSDLPSSAVSDPIVLTNSGGPVQDVPDPDPDPVSGFFELQGSGDDVYFKIQIENPNGTGGTNPGGNWNYLTAPDSDGNQQKFQGTGYYLFGATDSLMIDNDVGGTELLEYNVFFPSTQLGEYTFSLRVSRDDLGFAGDQQNDLWLNFKTADQPGNGNITQYLADNGSSVPEPTEDGFIKVFGGPQNGTWGATGSVDGSPGNFDAVINIDQPGVYTIQIDGRSQGYHIDYFELYKGVNPKNGFADSVFNDGIIDPPPPPPDGNEIRVQIDDSSDDWEQFGGGSSADLEFGLNGSPQYVGLRFDGLTIPDGRTIAEAYFEFDAFGNETGASSFTIQIEDSENATAYSSFNPPNERSYSTDDFVWNDVEPWTDGLTYRTPDISSLIEAVIGDDGVVGGDLAFLITGSGKRAAHSFDSGGGDVPELVILLEDDSIV